MTGDISENFKVYKQKVEAYFVATETYSKLKEIQVAKLFNILGHDDGIKSYNTFKLETQTVDTIFESLLKVTVC